MREARDCNPAIARYEDRNPDRWLWRDWFSWRHDRATTDRRRITRNIRELHARRSPDRERRFAGYARIGRCDFRRIDWAAAHREASDAQVSGDGRISLIDLCIGNSNRDSCHFMSPLYCE